MRGQTGDRDADKRRRSGNGDKDREEKRTDNQVTVIEL